MDREVDAGERCSWREVDRNLRSIAHSQAELDAKEAPWLRLAEELQIWRHVGMVSALDYLERVLGYDLRTAQERLRVARALGTMPLISEALRLGAIRYSAVRALTRVATPETEQAWLDSAIDKTVRQVYDLVEGHEPGSLPGDPPDPALKKRVQRFELDPETYALFRQARLTLDEEHGAHLDDSQLMAALCAAVLDGKPGSETDGVARFQIALTVCRRCDQGWQDGAGAVIPVDASTVGRAHCDGQMIGSIDDPIPTRAAQDVAPSVARLVWRRDHGRCQTPGCRSARGIEIHHIIARADGGSHEARNLILQCSACHAAVHRGRLTITGTAPDELHFQRVGEPRPMRETHDVPAQRGLWDVQVGKPDLDRNDPDGSSESAVAVPSSAPDLETPAAANPTSETTPNNLPPIGDAESRPVAAPSRFAVATLRTQVRDALVGLGWKPRVARTASEAACVHVDAGATLEGLIREALRHCRKAA